jgi:hypothetical protein
MANMTLAEEEGTKRDEADTWRARADELADWAAQTLVNRRDIYGGQYVDDSGAIRRITRHDGLTWGHLFRHFAADDTEDVLGVHATAPDETCRWGAVDIDAHDGQGASPEGNFRFARVVRRRAHEAGLDVRLVDSSGGRGGYHVWSVFDRPIPMSEARRLVLWLAHDWAEHGLLKRPDLFPGNHHLTGKRCGNWLRLLGRHHRRPSWAIVWSPTRKIWRTGDEAIDALLTLRGKPVDVASIVPADFEVTGPRRSSRPHGSKVAVSPPAVTKTRGEAPSPAKRHGRAGGGVREVRYARAALEFYPNNDLDYDDWLEIGMALRNLNDEATGFRIWNDWSSTSDKYDPEVTAAKWESLRPADESGGVGLGTLHRRAIDSGWSGPAFLVSQDAHGLSRATHRSGRRGTIVVPARVIGGGRPGPW